MLSLYYTHYSLELKSQKFLSGLGSFSSDVPIKVDNSNLRPDFHKRKS